MMETTFLEIGATSATLQLTWGKDESPGEIALWLDLAQQLAVVLEDAPSPDDLVTSIVKPSYWPRLCRYLTPGRARPVITMVGPTGNGKTTVAEAVLEVLGYAYEVLDMTEFVEPADLIGSTTYVLKDGQGEETWRDGIVTRCFREGKALLINEFDTANPRAAMCLQSVFQSPGLNKKGRYVTTPDGRVYPKDDCPIILTMNTFGSGASRMYVGRNALDAATLDRMSYIKTVYENEQDILERHGCEEALAGKLVEWAVGMRKRIDENALRVSLSNRVLLNMADSIQNDEIDFDQAVADEFLDRLDEDVRDILVEKKPDSQYADFLAGKPRRKFGT